MKLFKIIKTADGNWHLLDEGSNMLDAKLNYVNREKPDLQ